VLHVVLAADAIAADDVQAPSLGAGLARRATCGTHERMAAIGGNDLSFEALRHAAQ
jgi:hypothetical protein